MSFTPAKCPPGCKYAQVLDVEGNQTRYHCGYILQTGSPRGCDPGTWCNKYTPKPGFKPRKPIKRQPVEPKPCEYCGTVFTPKSPAGKFCCETCRHEAERERHGWKRIEIREIPCEVCGKMVLTVRGKKYCSDACREAVKRRKARERSAIIRDLQKHTDADSKSV